VTDRKPWFCPSCQKHHAPHVDTCPGPATQGTPQGIDFSKILVGSPSDPSTYVSTFVPAAFAS
jgi:hypothetical protein